MRSFSSRIALGLSCLSLGLVACGTKSFELPATSQGYVQNETVNTKVDVILMVDNSSSMSNPDPTKNIQKKLSDQIPSFIASLNAQGMDWQIGVTTSDLNGSGGTLVGTDGDQLISASTPNAVAKLQERVNAGNSGSDLERGIETTYASLQKFKSRIRSDAMLSIIFLSDDDDFSATTPTQFVNYINTIKPPFASGFQSWVANYLGVVTLGPDCTATNIGYNHVGQRYIDIANSSGGVKGSICSATIEQAVNNIRVRMNELATEFPLNRDPKVESITVTINGQAVPASTTNGWEYIPAKKVIKFHGNQIPKPNDSLVVHWDPASAT